MDIYFVEANDKIKIGASKETQRRVQELQVANSDKFKILYYIEGADLAFEKHVQGVCERYHIRGEWFEKGCLDHLLAHPWYKENMKKWNY